MSRRARVAGLGLALGLGFLPALAPAPVAAARPDLTVVGHATYDVQPEAGRVAVTVRLRATNHLRDTATRRFFFRNAFLTVLPGTSNFRISGGQGNPDVTVTQRRATYTNLRIDLGANLAAGRSTTLTLRFDLADRGGPPERAVRISQTVVSFSAWAFATPDTPGATVAVRMPEGYNVTIGRGPLRGPSTTPGGQEWTSGRLSEPLEFLADVAADRLGAPVETAAEVALAEGPAAVVVRSWPDDSAWRDRVLDLVQRALPVLEAEIGAPWPIEGPLVLEESLARGPDGYAGLFDPAEGRIEVSFAASDAIVLHELAHAWFNGALVTDRWAAEAFASYYADAAAARLGVGATPLGPVDPASAVAIPLNAWSQGMAPETEAYAYAAALELARAVAERAGADALQRVWRMAASGVPAYPPDPAADPLDQPDPEAGAGPPDWRGLLDLLEEASGQSMDDLWRTWVARPGDLATLDARGPARAAYATTLEAAGPWRLPGNVRGAMRAWQFGSAQELLDEAKVVLDGRDALEALAAEAGVTLPSRLREAFEGGSLAGAATEVEAERAVVDAIVAAEASRPATTDVADQALVILGLIANDPESRLGIARAAFAAGDLQTAFAAAAAADAAWSDAIEVGRGRIVSTVLLTIALVLLFGLFRQRQRRSGAAAATAASPSEGPAHADEPATAGEP